MEIAGTKHARRHISYERRPLGGEGRTQESCNSVWNGAGGNLGERKGNRMT